MSRTVKPPRSRRAERAEETRRRILDAATSLFMEVGFAGATIEAIAARADVAVETVYSRFRNKANLLDAILSPAISGLDHGTLFDRPEINEIRSCPDQRTQIRLLAHFSRSILQRSRAVHQILQTAASVDPGAAELQQADGEYRYRSQRVYIDMLLANGPLRTGLTPERAHDTYAALANPSTYAFCVGQRGWTPEQFEEWLDDSVARLLLP